MIRKYFVWLLISLVSTFTNLLYAQGEEISTSINVDGGDFQYYLVSSENYFHLVVKQSNAILYYKLDRGAQWNSSPVTLDTGGDFPVITAHTYQGDLKLHVFYRKGDEIKVQLCTDEGENWVEGTSLALGSNNGASKRIDAAPEGRNIHVTWDAGGDVYYNVFDFVSKPQGEWDFNPTRVVTNVTAGGVDAQDGHEPVIAVSGSGANARVHFLFRRFADPFNLEQIINRDFVSGNFQNPMIAAEEGAPGVTKYETVL